MIDHEDVWRAIDNLATRKGMSPSALARRAGLDPTTFNRSKRHAPDGRPRWPSTESVAKILKATETSIGELFGITGSRGGDSRGMTVPLIGSAHAGQAGAAPEAIPPAPARVVTFPDQRHEPMYALDVVGDSMAPLYRDGDVLFISPKADIRAGDRVVVKLTSGDLFIKTLRHFDGSTYALHAEHPDHTDSTVDAADVEYIARIVYASQ